MTRLCVPAASAAILLALAAVPAAAQPDTTRRAGPPIPAAPSAPAADDFAPAPAAPADDTAEAGPPPFYRFVLDYDVPESPAFAALGVAPGDVMGGAAAKPLVVNLLTQAGRGGKVQSGLGLDVSPVVLLTAVHRGALPLRADNTPTPWVSVLSRMTLSLGAISSELDTTDVQAGWGVRFNVRDPRDPLQNPAIRQELLANLSRALSVRTDVTGGGLDDAGVGGVRRAGGDRSPAPTLSEVYEAARERARSTGGMAVTVGYGGAGLLRGSVMDLDSLTQVRHRGWLAVQYSTGSPSWDLQGMLDYAAGPGDEGDGFRAGMALRAHTQVVTLAGELLVADGGLEPALKAEMRVIPRMSLLASLETERDPLADGSAGEATLRFKTHVRWNLSETR